MLVYLDNCSVQRPLDDRTKLRIRLEAEAILVLVEMCKRGDLSLVTSDALGFEVAKNPALARREFAMQVMALSSIYVEATEAVEQRARGFIEAGIQDLDALHLASAIEAQSDYFCTCDDRLWRAGQRVETEPTLVVTPLHLIEVITA